LPEWIGGVDEHKRDGNAPSVDEPGQPVRESGENSSVKRDQGSGIMHGARGYLCDEIGRFGSEGGV
jgi:hypothetical protein